jgi:type IV pilus assembly protein PilB
LLEIVLVLKYLQMSENIRYDEERNTQRRARLLHLRYIDTTSSEKKLFEGVLDLDEMYKTRVVPVYSDDYNITFGVTNTTSQNFIASLKRRFIDQQVSFGLISDSGYREYMRLFDPPKEIVYPDIEIKDADSGALVEEVSLALTQIRADDMLAYLVDQAHKLNASDIHVETQKEIVRIRFRLDGVLHPIAYLKYDKYKILLSAIASAGNISTGENRAQQGHISQHLEMADGNVVEVNVRLEAVTTINGIDVVMRLFNMDQSLFNLDLLGLSESELGVLNDIISKPSGLVLAVGPTGSGKTTTLYSMLNSLNGDFRKIITIEDPVEYQFSGITQIPIASKSADESHFAEGLRAILRLDPDIVMVGEVRDYDTAKTSLQAALTGHLVLSTFHASSASAALTRLIDVIEQNPLFISAIRLIMAQRLVRKLDDSTKEPYHPEENVIASIEKIIDSLPPGVEKPDLSSVTFYKPGSSRDNPYGYSGQIALREQLTITEPLRKLFTQQQNITTKDIEKTAIEGGMRTMLQDGILKVIAGYTTLDEIYRVLE